jgi:hypothetical protein
MNLFSPFVVAASLSIFLTPPSQAKANTGQKLTCRTNLAPPSRKSPITAALEEPASGSAAQALSALNAIRGEISQRQAIETATELATKEYERALVHLSEMTLQLEQAVRDEEEGKESPATAHFIFGQPAIERVLSLAVNEQIKRNPLVIKVPQPFGVSLLALLGIWTTQGEQILGKISQYVDFQGFVNDGLTMISSAPVDLSMQGSATVLVSSYAVAATVHFFYKFFRKKPGAKGDKSDVVQNQENITDRNHSFEISRHTSLAAVTTDQARSIPGVDLWTVTSSDPLSPKAEPEQLDIVLFSKEGQPALIVIKK